MIRLNCITVFLTMLVCLCSVGRAQDADPAGANGSQDFWMSWNSTPRVDMKLLPPVIAEPNQFVVPSPHGSAVFGKDGVTLVFVRKGESGRDQSEFSDLLTPQQRELLVDRRISSEEWVKASQPDVIRIAFVNPNPDVRIEGLDEQSGQVHHLIGSDPSKWTAYESVYGGVAYRDLWPGVDLLFRRDGGKLVCVLQASSGKALAQAKLDYHEITSFATDGMGDLVIETSSGRFTDTRPEFYQMRAGSPVALWGKFLPEGKQLGFGANGCEDEPPVEVKWTSGLVSGLFDSQWILSDSRRVMYDRDGAGFFSGTLVIPSSDGKGWRSDCFAARVEKSGKLGWITFLGGDSEDTTNAICIDRHGYVYLNGATRSGDFPTTPGAYKRKYNGSQDYFSARLNPSGASLAESSYLGIGGGWLGPETAPKTDKLLAIVVDDVKQEAEITDLLSLGIPMTFAMMPYCTPTCLDYIKSHGSVAFLHAPMEAMGSVNNRTAEICIGDSDERKAEMLEAWLARFPGVVGVNNHRGSMATSDSKTMQAILGVIRKHNLVFVDSHTAPVAIGVSIGREMNVPCAQQDIFLDHRDVNSVKARILAMAELAERTGYSVCICHVGQRAVPPAFRELIPELKAKGFRFVTVPDLLRAINSK